MNSPPADRWEFSLLVDRTSRIIEARGLFELYFGVRAGTLVGRHLVAYLDESERLAFLRYMSRLRVSGEVEPVTATLHTPAVGAKRFAMAARTGEGGSFWWLMFGHEENVPATPPPLSDAEQPFASTEEIATLADAHDHAKFPLDLTLFRAQFLRQDPPPRRFTSEARKALDDALGDSLRPYAHQHVVARPDIGEYALLHGRAKSVLEMGQRLVTVAQRHRLSARALGLIHETRRLPLEVPTAELIQEMRRKIRRHNHFNAQSLAVNLGSNWVPYAVSSGSALLLLAAWLLIRSRQ